ncbi:MAG: glycosyltransferase family 4 protein [Anaerolineae bacterium]|nr:glycosyltransferase family 4 protein [Anaerolineae bacterium]
MPSTKLSVLMTTDTIGGVWTYSLELARALPPAGITINLATMGAPLRPEQRRAMLEALNRHYGLFLRQQVVPNGRSARQRALRFSPARMANETLSVYQQMLRPEMAAG